MAHFECLDSNWIGYRIEKKKKKASILLNIKDLKCYFYYEIVLKFFYHEIVLKFSLNTSL